MIYELCQIASAVFKRWMSYFRSIPFKLWMLRFQRICTDYEGIRAPKAHGGYRQITYSHFSWTGLFLGGYQNWEYIHVLSSFANNLQLPFFESAEGRECGRAEARTLDPWIWQIRNLPSSLLHYWTLAGARTHDPPTTDKKSSALPTPLLVPAETNIGFSWLYPSYKRVDIVL